MKIYMWSILIKGNEHIYIKELKPKNEDGVVR